MFPFFHLSMIYLPPEIIEIIVTYGDYVTPHKESMQPVFEDIKNGAVNKKIEPSKITSGVVPQGILDRVKEEGDEIRSLLGKGEQ